MRTGNENLETSQANSQWLEAIHQLNKSKI